MADSSKKDISVSESVIARIKELKKETADFTAAMDNIAKMIESENKAYKPGQRNHQKLIDSLRAAHGFYETRIEQNEAEMTRLAADDVISKI